MRKSRLIYALMLSSAFMSFKANATEYRDCPPDVCTSHEGHSMCSECVYNENNQVIAGGYMDEGRFVPREYRKYDDDGKLTESYLYDTFDDPIFYAKQYIYNDAGQLVQENTKTEYNEVDFNNLNVSDHTYGDFGGQEDTYSYKYDNAGHLTEKYWGEQLAAKYNYDNAGHLIEEYSNGQLVAKYSYEDGHLVAKASREGYEEEYKFSLTTYDSAGNEISKNYFYGMGGSCENNDERFEFSCRKDLGNGRTIICVGEEWCDQYYLEDANGNLSECNGFVNALLGITIADEQKAQEPVGIPQADGSVKFVDDNGNVRYEGKRIYTVDEALEVSGPKNRFRIRYK